MDLIKSGYLLYGAIVAATLTLTSSCEKVIDMSLEPAEPRIVIEAEFCDALENHVVRITKTNSLTDTGDFAGVANAVVELSNPSGQIFRFQHVGKGLYRSSRIRATAGNSYTLKVVAEGKTYTAISLMAAPVKPDSISFKKLSFPGDNKVYPSINYNDPPTVQNNYRIVLRINSKYISSKVTDDRFNNGNTVAELIYNEGDDLKAGDKLEIDLMSIDRNVFKYYYALSQINGNGGPPVSPDNPVSNFNNGALGIFSAHSKYTLYATIR